MAPPPIQPSTIATFIHWISPTVQEIPPHMLAKELAFRHTYLSLSPDDSEYLLWPSDDKERILEALAAFQSQQTQSDDAACSFEIRYKDVLAHVRVTPALRLVFTYDGEWKYSNAALMPFPDLVTQSPLEVPVIDDGEDTPDAYWDSYGDEEGAHAVSEDKPQEQREADYWAQYEGTADSLIPSPAPEKAAPISFSYDQMLPKTDHITETLADRLELLAKRAEEEDAATVVSGDGDGLRDALRGVWRLWKAGRAEADKEMFRRAVEDVLAE
uniref:Uncharacterized protein n=1 Tax=Mycena chlorophos TaxID=658473 RepID=A0ABQ0M5K6_MYCCL|nr:predicted protein [Mycena chlorophos]